MYSKVPNKHTYTVPQIANFDLKNDLKKASKCPKKTQNCHF